MITHLEPDILECEVKWALESITMNKVSGGDGIPVELFQILKDDAVKVLYSVCQQIWKTQQWPQDWKKVSFHSNLKERQCQRMFKLCTFETRDLFKKIRNAKGIFHEKMGLIEDRNGMDLTEAEDIKKRWQNTQRNCTKKIFTTQIITMV